MKNIGTIALFFILLIVIKMDSYPQAKDNKGKSFYTWEEIKERCGIPIDPEEMKLLYAKQDSMYKDYLSHKELQKITTIPNWREVMSDVDNQGQCGNCWAYAATGLVEGQLQILYGSAIGEGINLNETDISTYFYPNDPCSGSLPTTALNYIRNQKAISEVGAYPNLEGVRWGIASYITLSGITAIKNALADGPVIACFQVYQDFATFFNYYENRTKVYRYNGTDPEVAGHAVVIVSYNDDEQYWLCKNSWGSNWADNGYFRIGYGECLIESWQNCKVTVNQSCYG